MSEKQQSGKWSDPVFLHSLLLAIYSVTKENFTKQAKDGVEEKLQRAGFDGVTWDSIRYVCLSPPLFISPPATSSGSPPSWAYYSLPQSCLLFFSIPSPFRLPASFPSTSSLLIYLVVNQSIRKFFIFHTSSTSQTSPILHLSLNQSPPHGMNDVRDYCSYWQVGQLGSS